MHRLPFRHTLPVVASYVIAALLLLIALHKGLIGALFSGLLVYSLIHQMTPLLGKRLSGSRGRLVAATIIGAAVVTLLTLAIWGLVSLFQGDLSHGRPLLQRIADLIEASRAQFPSWLKGSLPVDADDLSRMMSGWLHNHAVEARTVGAEAGRMLAHLLIGMIIGAMVAVRDTLPDSHVHPPLAAALRERIFHLRDAFQSIIFAQVWISVINTAITAVYIFVVLPLAGISLPLSKSLLIITFFAGLLPVIGNLVSNTLLVIASLSISFHTAVASLVFLVGIHKLEYFLNARIIGNRIQARAWEILGAMLFMEALFGIPGVIAAPVFYAYVKRELAALKLV